LAPLRGVAMLEAWSRRSHIANRAPPGAARRSARMPCFIGCGWRAAPWITEVKLLHRLAAALALASAAAAQAADAALVFIAPANHTLPFVDVRQGVLQGGILKDLGEALAARVGMKATFVVVPARRVSAALDQGDADALCYTSGRWIDARQVHWSRPMFDYTGVVARRADAPKVDQLSQLAGVTLGTVAGYRYPEVEQALADRFQRDDAPDMSRNLAKLSAGRVRYAMTEKLTLAYAMRDASGQGLVQAFSTVSYPTHCAFSTRRGLPLARLDQAVDALLADGSIERILARYR